MKPLIWAQVTKSEKKLLQKIRHSQYDLLTDAKTGEILVFSKGGFFNISAFAKLRGLTDKEIQILRYLSEKRTKFFPADLSVKIQIPKATITKSLKTLVRKKLATYEKIGRDLKYFSIIDRPELRITEAYSDKPVLTNEKLSATVQKQTMAIKELEKMVSNWFPETLIVSHELIYLPVYVIRYNSRKGERTVEINGVTGRQVGINGF